MIDNMIQEMMKMFCFYLEQSQSLLHRHFESHPVLEQPEVGSCSRIASADPCMQNMSVEVNFIATPFD